jgi:7-keto-8-aminopelargonate synthetase and related enzymes
MNLLNHFSDQLDQLKQQGNLRQFTSNHQHDRYISIHDHNMLNLASNDYLGLASNLHLREQVF